MKNILYKLRVCWIVLNSKGFIFVPSKVEHQLKAELGPKGEILRFNAAGNGGHIFGCTIIKDIPFDLHEEGFYSFDGTENKVR